MADFQNNADVARAGRVTGNRDVVTSPNILKWLAEGKIFEAGHGLQSDEANSQAETTLTPDDVKATFALQAPGGADTLVIPLVFKCMWQAEGSSATDMQLIFTKSSGECATTLALSGRAMLNAGQCLYSASPVKASPKASALYGVATTFLLTVTALTIDDQCMYDYIVMADNNVAAPLPGAANTYERYFLNEGAPHILTSGAAMIFYISATGGDASIHPYIQWAEVTEDDLL